jgi:S-adenosylmethionine:tRNA ribosyltransferase-isomerase
VRPTIDTACFDYELPAHRIAQQPVEPRDAARLLVDRGPDRAAEHRVVADLPGLLDAGDLLVVNDTRVRRARVRLRKPTGGVVEVLLLAPLEGSEGEWEALVRPSRRVAPGTRLQGAAELAVRVGDDLGAGRRRVVVESGDPEAGGEVPLPPYIEGELDDPERYQTVYARRPGSAAAPTAGLHLTDRVLDACREQGVAVASIELVVGLDTFRPIAVADVDSHPMHTEAYAVPEATWAAVESTRAAGGRVVAVGTTVVRSLESVAAFGTLAGRTDLFIRPGYRFAAVDRLLTNFHVPRTTLLALVAAFVGIRWRALYELALADGYRFLSFGDAMLLDRWRPA